MEPSLAHLHSKFRKNANKSKNKFFFLKNSIFFYFHVGPDRANSWCSADILRVACMYQKSAHCVKWTWGCCADQWSSFLSSLCPSVLKRLRSVSSHFPQNHRSLYLLTLNWLPKEERNPVLSSLCCVLHSQPQYGAGYPYSQVSCSSCLSFFVSIFCDFLFQSVRSFRCTLLIALLRECLLELFSSADWSSQIKLILLML